MNFWKKKNKDKKKVVYDNFEETYDERYCQPSNAYYEPTPFGGGRRHNSEVEVPEYQKLVDIYRNDIRLRLIPKQILHLLFLMDDTDIDAIKRLGESGPAPATDLLLDCIRSSPDQGKWREFINALEKTKYICLVKKIRRQKVKDDTDEREYIRIMMPQLRNLINPREIMAHLLYHDIIISDDKEEIECVMSNRGSIEASELLLERVSGKHPNWYPILTRELIQHGHQSAGNILLEGICRENTLKENPSMMTPGTRSKSDSQLMQPKYQSVAAATGIETQYPAYSGRNYAFNKLPIHFDEDEDEVYMDIDEAELDRLEANRHSPKRERKVRTVDFSYLTPKHSRKTYNEVKAVHFTGPEEDDKSSIYTIPPPDYDDEEPVQPPSPPSRLPIRTRPDLVSPTFPDGEGFDYVQAVREFDPKYSGQHSLKVGEVYRIKSPRMDGLCDDYYRSVEGKLIPKGYVEIFQKEPKPRPNKSTPSAHLESQSQETDTGETDRDLLMKILKSQEDLNMKLAEHQKILNNVCETPIYQAYYNSKQTGPVVTTPDDNGEESDHYVEADADGN